jgi:hypothetical protein
MMRLLSLDIPWGSNDGHVGAAFAEVNDLELLQGPLVDSVDLEAPPAGLPIDDLEIAGFIANGAGPNRARPQDEHGEFFDYYPSTPAGRTRYLQRLWNAFVTIRNRLQLEQEPVDLVVVDVPLVPAALSQQPIPVERRSQRRPVERAFEKKVWVPGSNPRRGDGRINLAVLQSGNINRYRPGYATCRLAQLCFQAQTVVESFPQLTVGALAELADDVGGVVLAVRAAEHKRNLGGQAVLDAQIELVFPNGLTWVDPNLPRVVKADGYDAVLGLLPALLYAGYVVPVGLGVCQNAVLLRNQAQNQAPLPRRITGEPGAQGTAAWKAGVTANDANLTLLPGIDDRGILAVDLSLWQ